MSVVPPQFNLDNKFGDVSIFVIFNFYINTISIKYYKNHLNVCYNQTHRVNKFNECMSIVLKLKVGNRYYKFKLSIE